MSTQTYIETDDGISLFCISPWHSRGWQELKAIANGCGPKGWKIDFVPDSIIGCKIQEACIIHDVMYEEGESVDDKNSADRSFLNNMTRLIRARTTTWLAKKLLLNLRLRLAYGYYIAVSKFGGQAFWDKHIKKP